MICRNKKQSIIYFIPSVFISVHGAFLICWIYLSANILHDFYLRFLFHGMKILLPILFFFFCFFFVLFCFVPCVGRTLKLPIFVNFIMPILVNNFCHALLFTSLSYRQLYITTSLVICQVCRLHKIFIFICAICYRLNYHSTTIALLSFLSLSTSLFNLPDSDNHTLYSSFPRFLSSHLMLPSSK